MDLKILNFTSTQDYFDFNDFSSVEGLDQLMQTVLIEFLKNRSDIQGVGSSGMEVFSYMVEAAARAKLDSVIVSVNSTIKANQENVQNATERLKQVTVTGFGRSNNGWAITLFIESEAGETAEQSVVI